MFTAGELERASMALNKPMKGLEMRIMSDIVRRIRENGEITAAADWQITRLVQLGMGMDEIKAAINEALGESEDITSQLFSDVIKAGYARDADLYKATGKTQVPFEENRQLQQLIGSVESQTNATMQNITQSLGFAQRGSDGHISFTPVADYYQKTLDNAMLDIASGAFDYNTVLKRTIKEMTNSGLRTIDYASGYSNRVDVAARRAIMTGMNQLTAKVNEQNAEALDTEWFEISWHSGFRPTHWWGGRWYKKQQLGTICGLGDVAGLCGANCYHDYSPVIPGISEPTYTDEELAEMNRREQEPIEYNGKKYTKYEATQRQRQLETTMRAQREEMALLKEGGADEDDLINCRARYMGTSHEYATFSEAMGLPQERQRVSADGLGSIMKGNTEGGSGKESPVKVPAVGAHVTDKVTAEERKELLSQNKVDIHNSTVDKSAKSGIIRENSKPKPITEITDKAIESVPKVHISGYTDEQCAIIQQQHKELLEYSRKHNNNNEVAFVFDSSLDSRKEFMGSDDKIDFGRGLYGSNITVLHNHPRNSSYSVTDIIFFGDNSNIKTLTIVKNNGKVEYLTKGEKFDSALFKLEYDRLYRKIVKNGTDTEKDKFVKTLLNKSKSGVIWSERT